MLKTVNSRNLIIVILCIVIIALGIGFGCLSMDREREKNKSKSYDISISKVEVGTPIRGGSKVPEGSSEVINNNKTVNFTFNLLNPKDSINYNVVIKNKGDLTGKIDEILAVPDYIKNDVKKKALLPVAITQNDLKGKVLEKDEEVTLTITAKFLEGAPSIAKKINYQITILTSCTE